jgi:hypothetical protein
MKSLSLISFLDSFQSLNKEQFVDYLSYFGTTLKERENSDFCALVCELLKETNETIQLSEFYIGYTIPQISKEFDFLRLGSNFTLDIEVKNKSDAERIKKQLVENRYYLKALGVPVKLFTYVIESQSVYTLDSNENLIESTIDEILRSIQIQRERNVPDIDALFKPSEYLVSPLNSTDKFMNGEYFLNGNQLTVKDQIMNSIDQDLLSFFAIEGKPGTGKTLITYDIAKHYIDKGWDVGIVHCGMLSEGHYYLSKNAGWNIYSAKGIDNILEKKKFDLIIIDETQRIYSSQLSKIIDSVNNNESFCIFSYDREQVFSSEEMMRNITETLEGLDIMKYTLKDRIRTNKEISSFISNLFNKRNVHPQMEYRNIHLRYFNSSVSLRKYLYQMKNNNWEVINYTPSNYNFLSYDKYQVGIQNAHKVIGQEFDKVAAVINQHFRYNKAGNLVSSRESGSPNYRLDKMLYQMLTRAREELTIIIYKNPAMLEVCLRILNKK